MRKLTTKEFIEKAMKVHGNKFNYSKVEYKNNQTKVEIVCREHESFFQRPNNHLLGRGCEFCSGTATLNLKAFVERANKIHNNKYKYTKAIYITTHYKIEIICSTHGSFWQTPHSHLQKNGCPVCSGRLKLTKEQFIEKARQIHGNKFDYSKLIYKSARQNIKIACPIHGIFWQTPDNHLHEHGCPKCSHRISKIEIKWLNEQQIPLDFRQYKIKINNRQFKVDGYDPVTNTIYEFLGDYWHGNPKQYKPDEVNKTIKKTFGALYEKTINKINFLKESGYNIRYIWESDYSAKD